MGADITGPKPDEAKLLGSVAWQDWQEQRAISRGGAYNRVRELRRFYRALPAMKAAVTRINSGGESETGRALHHMLVNVLELETALARPYGMGGLNLSQRICFKAVVIERQGYAEFCRHWEIPVNAVQQHVSRAFARLVAIIYDGVEPEEDSE